MHGASAKCKGGALPAPGPDPADRRALAGGPNRRRPVSSRLATCCEVVIRLVACEDCDLLHRLGDVPEGGAARCRRCRGLLRRRPRNGLEHALALALAAAVLFVAANSFPFLAFEMNGRVTQTTLVSGVIDLYQQDKPEIAALVAFTIVVAPLVQIVSLLYVLLPLRWNRVPWQLSHAFRLLRHIQPWSMMEVFIIGILVAIVKLMELADIVPGLALWSFVLLMLSLAGAVASFDPEAVWERLRARP